MFSAAMAGQGKLSARAAATAKLGRHGDGRGLWLAVSETGARKWVFRFTFGGRVTEMGLGNADVTLAQARDRASEARKLVAVGVNPIKARREAGRIKAGKPTTDEYRRDRARLPVRVLRLGSRRHKHPREVGEMALAHAVRQDGSSISAVGFIPQAAQAYGDLGFHVDDLKPSDERGG